MRGHVSAQTVAEYADGVLPRRKAARVAAHLSGCPQCAEVEAQLAAVTVALAQAPAPALPEAVAARLDAALAAEVARATAQASTAASGITRADAAAQPPPMPRTAVPGRATHRAPRRGTSRLGLRLAAAAAAVVVLAGGAYTVSRLLASGGAGITASPGAPEHRTAAGSINGPAGGPAAAPASGFKATNALPVISSGTDYRPALVRLQVAGLLLRYRGVATGHEQLAGPAPTAHSPTFSSLSACVRAIAGGTRPRLVDLARYGGRPAAVIVVPVPSAHAVRVWVVRLNCPTGPGRGVLVSFTLPVVG